MAARRLLLTSLLASVISARSNVGNLTITTTTTTTTTEYVSEAATQCAKEEAPSFFQPFTYLPCESCNPCLVTNMQQPITSLAVNNGKTTNYVAPFSDWNFKPTKTVTAYTGTGPTPECQIQTWSEKNPTISMSPQKDDNTAEYHHQCERLIEYVVEEYPSGATSPVTVTITSTQTIASSFTSTCPCQQVQTPPPGSPTGGAGQGAGQSGAGAGGASGGTSGASGQGSGGAAGAGSGGSGGIHSQ